MAKGKNAADKRSRERRFYKKYFNSYKRKHDMVGNDRKAVQLDWEANDGLTEDELLMQHYSDCAKSYNAGHYDREIYGYIRSKVDLYERQNKRRKISIAYSQAA